MDYSKYFEELINIGAGLLCCGFLFLIFFLVLIAFPYFMKFCEKSEIDKNNKIKNLVTSCLEEKEKNTDETKRKDI